MAEKSINHILIAVGTPRSNGQVERFNRDLQNCKLPQTRSRRDLTPMLAKLCETPERWDRVLQYVEFAINNTICRSTGETPSKLLFGVDQVGISPKKIEIL